MNLYPPKVVANNKMNNTNHYPRSLCLAAKFNAYYLRKDLKRKDLLKIVYVRILIAVCLELYYHHMFRQEEEALKILRLDYPSRLPWQARRSTSGQ